jgi:hypothetical protein
MKYERKLFYIASPYSHKRREVRTERFHQVSNATVALLHQGIFVFSPIAYNHPMVKYDLPTSWEFWREYDTAFLEKCDGLIVLKLNRWEKSIGVSGEIEYAKENNIPITYLTLKEAMRGKFKLKYKK